MKIYEKGKRENFSNLGAKYKKWYKNCKYVLMRKKSHKGGNKNKGPALNAQNSMCIYVGVKLG